jgi:hypothetical protein
MLNEIDRTCSLLGSKVYSYLIRKPHGKRPLGWNKWEDNIQEMGWEGEDLIHQAQDKDLWWDLVNTVMNLWIP